MTSTIIDLSDLGSQGFVIQGDLEEDEAGWSVSGAGDVNGDGFADVVVGAPQTGYGPGVLGAAYVIFGKKDGFERIDLAALAPADGFAIHGEGHLSEAGSVVSSAGDLNGDGYDDVIVGARFSDLGGNQSGAAYVIFGKADGFAPVYDPDTLAPEDGFVLTGHSEYDYAGWDVCSAGDINRDGFDDVMVGVPAGSTPHAYRPGYTVVLFGHAGGFDDVDLGNVRPDQGFSIFGPANSYDFGSSLGSAGDVNGDGYVDLIINAFDDKGAYVILGKETGFTDVAIDDLTSQQGFRLVGSDKYVTSVASAGDVNADGYDDVIVGSAGIFDIGTAYVVFGKAGELGDVDLAHLSKQNGFAINGAKSGDYFGWSVAGAGDVNGDGYADLIVGAQRSAPDGPYSGAAYVLFGHADLSFKFDLKNLTPDQGFMIQGDKTYDFAGTSVAAAGDVNNDGFDDVIVGAPENNDGDTDAGAAYVVFGMAPTESVTRIGTDIANTIRGGIGNDKLDGRGGDDTLISAEGSDKLLGRGGNDDLQGGDGKDRLEGGAGDDYMHGGTGEDRLSGGRGVDVLYGGADKDILTGGTGPDTFHFSLGGTAADVANADVITDFNRIEHDLLDLSDYDADPSTKKVTDPFTFVGTSAFSGAAGELRYEVAGSDTLITGDTNGDKAADFTIRLTGTIALTSADFLFAIPATPGHAVLAHADITANPLLHLA